MGGLSMYLYSDPAQRDERSKRNLAKQWYWQYASHVIQGIGMAAVNFIGIQ